MSESLGQTSDATWLEAKAAMRRAGLTLLGLAVERAVSRAESVIDYIEAHAPDSAADPQAREVDSPGEADPPGQEADSPRREATAGRRRVLAAAPAAAGRTDLDGISRSAGDDADTDADSPAQVAGEAPGHSGAGLMGVLSDLLQAGLQLAMDLVERLAGRLEEIVAGGGVVPRAGLGAGIAALVGRNPIWGAIKGAFSALSPGAKVALIIALVLAAILLPVTILLLLIALVVIVVILAVKTRSRST